MSNSYLKVFPLKKKCSRSQNISVIKRFYVLYKFLVILNNLKYVNTNFSVKLL